MITVLTVNYNTPDYLERLLTSFRKFYDIPYLVIDGSSEENYKKIKNFDKKFNIKLIHLEHSIHYDLNMIYGIRQIETDQILLVDFDMIIHSGGWLERMEKELHEDSYGIGDIQREYYVDIQPTRTPVSMSNIRARNRLGGTRYKLRAISSKVVEEKIYVDSLQPTLALCNKSVMLKYLTLIKGSSPLIEVMRVISQQGKGEQILQKAEWLVDDLHSHRKQYVERDLECYSTIIDGQRVNSKIKDITALTVNYNTPDILKRLLSSFRKFYDLPYVVIDGSDERNYRKIKNFPEEFNIKLIHFDYNIHHGPGLAYGIRKITTSQILLTDSDMIILNGGWLEKMKEVLQPNDYGTGDIQPGNGGQGAGGQGYIAEYMHPALALINREVALKYPMPDKSGMPMYNAMQQLKTENNLNLLKRSQWLTDDLWKHLGRYVQHGTDHEGMSTVRQTGGYNY